MSNEQNNTPKLSRYPNFDYQQIADAELFVYFHQMRMDILLEGVSYVGIWSDSTGQLLISVSDEGTAVRDGKLYLFGAPIEETQHPERIAEHFKNCARQIMLDEAGDNEAPNEEFPDY